MKKLLSLFAVVLFSLGAMADNYLPGDWNSWNNTDNGVKFVNNEVTLSLTANTTYYFKIYDNSYADNTHSYGNGGVMDYFNHTGWTFGVNDGTDGACQITTQAAGNYTFHISWEGSIPSISVDYPELDWSVVSFVASALGTNHANTYKIVKQGGVTVDVVQHPAFATADGIYMTFPDAAFGEIRSNGVKLDYDVQGAGIILHVANFVDQETEVNVMNSANDAVRFAFVVYNVNGRFYTEYDHASADAVTAHEACSPKFTWETDNNGNVVITISAGEGIDGETYFRGAKGMNGTFTLEGGNIGDYFTIPNAYTDKYTFTLSLIDPANKPAMGTKISYAGQIECRSNLHTNDWSDYTFSGFSYGAKVRVVADETAPTSFTATVSEEKAKSVIVTLSATDDNSPRVYYTITDGTNGEWHTAGNSGEEINYTITGLNLSTTYTFSVVVADNAGNETSPIVLNATTTAGVTPVHTFGVIEATAANCWTGTWDGNGDPTYNSFPYLLCYDIVRNNDNTISATTFVKVDPASDGKELFNTPGMVYQFVDYKGGTNYHNFVKNGDIYEASTSVDYADGEIAHFMFRMAYNAGGSTPEIWPTVAEEANTYTRTVTKGNFGTLCLPFNADVEGATLYTVAGKVMDGETMTGIALEEAESVEAGKAYIFKATDATLTATYTAVAAHGSNAGLVGNLTNASITVPEGNYVIMSDNLIHKVVAGGNGVTIGANRAYIDITALEVATPAPGRIIVAVTGENEVTAVENVEAATAVKFIENGILYIRKNGRVYNAMGQLVK